MSVSEVSESTADLAGALRRSLLRFSRTIRQQRVDSSISLGQLTALGTLFHEGAMTPGELATHERLQPPSITKMLAVLEGYQLIDRKPHPSDRRQAVITVTEAGRALVLRERELRETWLALKLVPLTEDDLATLRRAATILDRLVQE
jgi:DNA-binding MarR family transcriptional regulator